MCGIAGIFNYQDNRGISGEVLEKMLQSINYRGPDEKGIYVNKNLGLGNVRLSIVDIAGGKQPMRDFSGNYWIVYNGEVFNYPEIRTELEKSGCPFQTKSDTEVILNAYIYWGTAFLSKLNGQFAFAIWNKQKQELFLARDRVGICPLYYTSNNGSFIFGSEIKAILQVPGIYPQLSMQALFDILTFWTTITPSTIFNDIKELSPGHFLKVGRNRIETGSYWKLNFPEEGEERKITFADAKEEVEQILTDAVRVRLRADVPVAAYLSGGIDSTTTTALIKKIDPAILNTFSIGFEESTFDESGYQLKASEFLQTHHKSISCKNNDIASLLPEVIWHTESPLLRTAPVPMFCLSKFVRQNNIKVVITGEGADEMLGGYDIFKEMAIRKFWSKFPKSKYRPLLLKKLYPYIPQINSASPQALSLFFGYKLNDIQNPFYSHLLRWNNGKHILKFLHPSFLNTVQNHDPYESLKLPFGFEKWSNFSRAQYLESSIFMSGYLLSSQGDRMTMANSVEGRYPFLDHRFIEFAASLPDSFKLKGLEEKYLLKKMISGKIPESIVKRPKQAYRAPINTCFFNKNKFDYLDYILSPEILSAYEIFDPHLTRKLFEKVTRNGSASEIENMTIVAIISTQLFYQLFIMGKSFESNSTLKNNDLHVINET